MNVWCGQLLQQFIPQNKRYKEHVERMNEGSGQHPPHHTMHFTMFMSILCEHPPLNFNLQVSFWQASGSGCCPLHSFTLAEYSLIYWKWNVVCASVFPARFPEFIVRFINILECMAWLVLTTSIYNIPIVRWSGLWWVWPTPHSHFQNNV